MDRQERAALARETLKILERGYYRAESGRRVEIEDEVARAVDDARLYKPEELEEIAAGLKGSPGEASSAEMEITVREETTLQAAERLVQEGEYAETACLNFASAYNPGGGFLEGSGAQEESLARSSALYPTIEQMKEMYEANRQYGSSLYLDYMIYSPEVPVIRRDEGDLLEEPFKVSFITAPAVNAGAVKENEPGENVERIEPVMVGRIEKLLALAVEEKVEALVLGAFGCGVFQNDPEMVADIFRRFLYRDERFRQAFARVVFAVRDSSAGKETLKAFEKKLESDEIRS